MRRSSVLGVGLANDLCEPGCIDVIAQAYDQGLCDYLVVYIYNNYSPEFLQAMRDSLPKELRYVWHAGGEFEIPLAHHSLSKYKQRLGEVNRLWSPEWATEDLILTNFGGSVEAGDPNYVPVFLTEESLEVCIERTHAAIEEAPFPFFPEVPHYYMPVPEEMHLATFFRRYIEATGVLLNFDIGHYASYNLLHGRPILDRIEEFPLEAVGEINSAGGMVGDPHGRTWLDDYSGPINPVTIRALETIIPRCTNLKAIYTETIGAPAPVVFHNLRLMKALFGMRSVIEERRHEPA